MEKREIKLSKSDKAYPIDYISKGRHSARVIKWTTVLLHLNSGKTIREPSVLSQVSQATVSNLKSSYKEEKIQVAKVIEEKPRLGQPPKIIQQVEAKITSLAYSKLLMEEASGA